MKKVLFISALVISSSEIFSAAFARRSVTIARSCAPLLATLIAHPKSDTSRDSLAEWATQKDGEKIPHPPAVRAFCERYCSTERQRAAELIAVFEKTQEEADLKVALEYLKVLRSKLLFFEGSADFVVAGASRLAALTDPVMRIYNWQVFVEKELLDEAFEVAASLSEGGWTVSSPRAKALLKSFKGMGDKGFGCAAEAVVLFEAVAKTPLSKSKKEEFGPLVKEFMGLLFTKWQVARRGANDRDLLHFLKRREAAKRMAILWGYIERMREIEPSFALTATNIASGSHELK